MKFLRASAPVDLIVVALAVVSCLIAKIKYTLTPMAWMAFDVLHNIFIRRYIEKSVDFVPPSLPVSRVNETLIVLRAAWVVSDLL